MREREKKSGFYFLFRELSYISMSNCFWNTYKHWSLSLFFYSTVISCSISKLATGKHQIRNSTGRPKCSRNWKKKKKSFLFFPFLYSYICMRSMLYVSAGSVYTGLIYAKACGYEKIWRYVDMNYKVYEKVNVFNCIRLWDTSL